MLKTAFCVTATLVLGAPAFAEEVLIGAPVAMTGPLAPYAGPPMKAGTEVGAEVLNAKGAWGHGRQVKVLTDDFASDKAQAISLTTRMITRDNVAMMLSPPTSIPATAAVPVANSLSTPIIGLAYSDQVAKAGPWGFKIYVDAAVGSTTLAHYARDKMGVKSVAVVYDKTNDGATGIKTGFVTAAKQLGINVVSEDGYVTTDTNFAAIVTKIAASAPDALFVSGTPEAGANVIVQARQAGLKADTKLLGMNAFGSPNFTKVGGKAVEGMVFPADYSDKLDTPDNKAFVEAYRKKTGRLPDTFAATSYAGMQVAAAAVSAADTATDRTKIRDALAGLRNIHTVLGYGDFSFDDQRFGVYKPLLLEVRGGDLQIIGQ